MSEETVQIPHIDETPIPTTAAMAKMMVQLVRDELNALGVPNYLTLGIADENGLTYQFTVRRPGCETAEDQVVRLTKERHALAFEVTRLRAEKSAADAAKLKGDEPLLTVERVGAEDTEKGGAAASSHSPLESQSSGLLPATEVDNRSSSVGLSTIPESPQGDARTVSEQAAPPTSATPPRWTEEQRETAWCVYYVAHAHDGEQKVNMGGMNDRLCAEIARVAPLFSAPGAGVTRAELYRAVLHSMASPNKSDQGDAAKVTDAVLALLRSKS